MINTYESVIARLWDNGAEKQAWLAEKQARTALLPIVKGYQNGLITAAEMIAKLEYEYCCKKRS